MKHVTKDQFVALLDGKDESEVFGADDEETEAPAVDPEPERKGTATEGARPVPRPRPGFEGA